MACDQNLLPCLVLSFLHGKFQNLPFLVQKTRKDWGLRQPVVLDRNEVTVVLEENRLKGESGKTPSASVA